MTPTYDFVIEANGEAASAVPEPAGMSLVGGGLLVGALVARRRLAAR